MALVTIKPIDLWPWSAPPDRFTMTADAASEGAGWVFQAPVTDTLTHLIFATGTVTTGATVNGRIETIGANGFPSGTLYDANATGTLTLVATTDNNKILELAINGGTGIAITKGDAIACTVRAPSGSPGTFQLAFAAQNIGIRQPSFPYAVRDVSGGAGNWEHIAILAIPMFAIRCSTAGITHIPSCYGPSTSNTGISGWTSASNPDEIGNSFIAPAKLRICGAQFRTTVNANTGDYRINLRSSSGTLLANTADMEGDVGAAGWRQVIFPTPYEVAAGTRYDITLEARTATAAGGLWNHVASGYLAAMPSGADTYRVSYNNGASRTTDTTQVTGITPLVDQIDDGAGVSSSVYVTRPSTLLRR